MVDRVQITLSLSVAPLHLLSLAVLNQTGTRTQNVAIGDNHLITLWRGILEGVGLKGFLEGEGFFYIEGDRGEFKIFWALGAAGKSLFTTVWSTVSTVSVHISSLLHCTGLN